MHMWTIDYVNLNENTFFNIYEAYDNLISVGKEIFKWRLRKK